MLMYDTDPGEQCIVNEELNYVHCFCDTDNCNVDHNCNCDFVKKLQLFQPRPQQSIQTMACNAMYVLENLINYSNGTVNHVIT